MSYQPDLYDVVTPPAVQGDVDWYRDKAQSSGGPVLELGAGTGRITLAIAAAGIAIHALDSDDAMLERLRLKLESAPADARARTTVVAGDMRHFRSRGTIRADHLPVSGVPAQCDGGGPGRLPGKGAAAPPSVGSIRLQRVPPVARLYGATCRSARRRMAVDRHVFPAVGWLGRTVRGESVRHGRPGRPLAASLRCLRSVRRARTNGYASIAIGLPLSIGYSTIARIRRVQGDDHQGWFRRSRVRP